MACLVETEPARPASGSEPAVGPVYRAAYAKNGVEELSVQNLRQLFEASAAQYPNRPCLGFRRPLPEDPSQAGPYEWMTYSHVAEGVAAAHGGLESLGLGAGDRVGVIGVNCPEWMITLQALNRMNGVCVPLYDTLGDAAVQFIIGHAECKLVVSQAAKLPLLAQALAKGTGVALSSGIVYWGTATPEALKALSNLGVSVISWDQLITAGRTTPVAPRSPAITDTCTIMYTSGTTGDPKGVVLSHRALLVCIAGVKQFLAHFNEALDCNDVFLSYLPLAHVFDRMVEEVMLQGGGSIAYWQGDIKRMLSDVEACKPTLFAGVPRVFERIHGGVMDKMKKAGFLANTIFSYAYWRKLYYLKYGWRYDQASWLSDQLVFKKIKEKLGGKVRVIVSGGAPMSHHVEEFLKVSMCAPVAQGYGLTETCAASFISYPFDYSQVGTVGPPLPHTELRLQAEPEMGYDPMANPPRGEICIRSAAMFGGYYKQEAMTKECVDADGFFHSGDIGEIMPSGALKVIDRKKNLFKLSQGEYIAVERVENSYKGCSLTEQIWVYGNSMESALVAVVVPREHELRDAAKAAGVAGAQDCKLQELLSNPAVNQLVLAELKAAGKAAKLKSFEEVKAVYLEEHHFSVENDLMTATFKLKRSPLQKKYKEQVDAMYVTLNKRTAA